MSSAISAYDARRLVLLSKERVWDHSINNYDTLHNKQFAQVASFATVEQQLMYIEEYHNVTLAEPDFQEFLESQSGKETLNETIFDTWTYELMSLHDYYCDDRYGHSFPCLDPEKEDKLGNYEILMIIYPEHLRKMFYEYPDESSEEEAVLPPVHNFTQSVVTPTVDRLSQEILDLYKSKKDNSAIVPKRRSIVDRIASMLRRHYQTDQIQVEMFGSCANGLDTMDSDLDLCIIIPRPWIERDTEFGRRRIPEHFGTYYNMAFICRKLGELGMIERQAIPNAVVPICKFKDPQSGISCDINTGNDMGVENSKLINAYTNIDWRVRPFLYAIKHFSKQHKINDASRGYLSSYSYVMMGLYYLMICDPPVIPNLQTLGTCSVHDCRTKVLKDKLTIYKGNVEEFDVSFHTCVQAIVGGSKDIEYQSTVTYWKQSNTDTLGELLTGFFRYYAFTHDYYNTMITIYHGPNYFRPRNWQKNAIVIQDPFIKSRNVSGSCKREAFLNIKKEFGRAYSSIMKDVTFQLICQPYQILKQAPIIQHNNRHQSYIRRKPRAPGQPGIGRNRARQGNAQLSRADEPQFEPERRIPIVIPRTKTVKTTSTTASLSDSHDRVIHTLSPPSDSEPCLPQMNTVGIANPNEYVVKFVDMIPNILDKKDFKDALSEYGRVVDIQTIKRLPEPAHEDWHMCVVLDDPVNNSLPEILDVYEGIQTIKSPDSSTDGLHSATYICKPMMTTMEYLSVGALNDLTVAMQGMALGR